MALKHGRRFYGCEIKDEVLRNGPGEPRESGGVAIVAEEVTRI